MPDRIHAFTDDALGDLDAVGLAAALRVGDLSPREAAEAASARVDALVELSPVAFDDRERGVKRAVDAPWRADAPFAGVPTYIKNNTAFAGIPTRHGSAATPRRAELANEPFTEQFLSTGLNVLGASTLPAFGLTATTEFDDGPPTRNPWNPEYSCGASSGGAAVLVAGGAVPIAHANDGGGSIRIPAAACGLVGLKPTRDRLVKAAQAQGMPVDLISNGVVTRTVRDTAHFLAAAERHRPTTRMPFLGLVEGPSERRLRIGLIDTPITGNRLDVDTARALDETVELLTDLGHDVVPVPLPVDRSFIGHFTHYWSMLAFAIAKNGKKMFGTAFEPAELDPFTIGLARGFLRNAWRTPGAIAALSRSAKRYHRAFDRVDVICSPTLAHTTPRIGYLDPAGEFEQIFDRLVHYVAFTPLNNAAGGPAISLPLAQSSEGLPIGIHFSADHANERTLLELAYELEAAEPFARIQD
ncbi:amidase [Aeromicrobium sp. PE09-221]|uniref:amidase n=1 Tax=Aeromicrobium sp. PE09-221 TaxID=1898043 RepID=UPI000B3ECCA2|nr:amidase [Aeromicrobium sp. PE09-221]OUZ09404.1 amidase [Aeromicrobium sp. PE09-221]